MRRGRSALALGAAAMLAAPAVTAQSPPLTLTDAVAAALDRHPAIVAADRALEGARAGAREPAAARWPAVRVELSATQFQEPMVVAPLHGFDPQSPPLFDRTLMQLHLGASYTLFDGGRRRAAEDGAAAITRRHEADRHAAEQDVIAGVVSAWLEVAAGRELVRAEDRRLEALLAERDRVEQLLEVGRAAPVERLRVAAAIAAAEAGRTTRALDVERAEAALARHTGIAMARIRETAIDPVASRGDLPESTDWRARLRGANPTLARAEARVRAAAAADRAAAGAWWPELRLQAGYTDYSSGDGRLTGEWQAGLQAGYALFAGGGRRAAAERAAREWDAALAERAAVLLDLDDRADRVYAAARTAAARTAALATAARHHEEVVRIERLALDAGAGTQTDWLAAEAALLTARSAWIEARHAEVAARLELARLSGTLALATLATLLETDR